MAFLNRNHDDNGLGLPEDDQGADGLPDGIEPPPVPRLPDIEWTADSSQNARLGIPQPGFPARPLPFEEAAVSLFNADQHELGKWGKRQRTLLPALHETATGRRGDLEQELEHLDRTIAQTEASIDEQRQQLAEQDLKYPRVTAGVDGALVFGTALGAGFEIIALQPVVGQVFATDDWKAWGFAALAVGAIGYASWQFGGLLHRWLAYEGPGRVRRALGWTSLGFGLFAVLALVGIVAIRILGRNAAVTDWKEAAFAACLYAAVQGLVQLAAMTHGWRHENPRVRELANTEANLDLLREDRQALDDALADTAAWAESLHEFQVAEWLADHRAQLAEDYAAADLMYRNELGQALIEAGHDEAANMLLILPLPRFVPPIDADRDDDANWISGFMLPL